VVLVCEYETSERKNQLLGFLLARITGEECELENVVVAAEFQRRGVGTQLIHALIHAARDHRVLRIFLEVRESNTPARSLYEKLGFEVTNRRQSYYNHPTEDAVLYVLALEEFGGI
jgi:ribosomal-protein-alanine N-acetyltransferase